MFIQIILSWSPHVISWGLEIDLLYEFSNAVGILSSTKVAFQSSFRSPTYPNTYAKVTNWIFDVQFPENWFEFDTILNDFWSSTIWAIQIQVSLTEFKNSKNPGIQPNHGTPRVFSKRNFQNAIYEYLTVPG